MSRVLTPQQLVEDFKKSGEFDRLRHQVLTNFMNSAENEQLMQRVKEIAKERLDNDKHMAVKSQDELLKQVLQELDRYPVVDRALESFSYLQDETFTQSLSNSLKETLDAAKSSKGASHKLQANC
ncbi:hypothetical protein EXIGLDRAFT_835333 [Exidia glandulosa HHB12029]|uniref:BOD1/SHG1 domain-containing protein n=1 Tax=Exidia glandulosa HHB12029 TaxID=1314781 RepID=A0A165IXL1_EXIGL|nr:hypothetical protein EXIGLDRAFT_835333 [Exidia glandulosa HHB12029]